MQCYRASLLRFDASQQAVFEPDGMLVRDRGADGVALVVAVGAYAALASRYTDAPVQHWPGRIIAPGFVDLHVHYPQVDVIGSPASGLLPWLENYTFPQESRFTDAGHARGVAAFFLKIGRASCRERV